MSTFAARYSVPLWAPSSLATGSFLVNVPTATVVIQRNGVNVPCYSDRTKTVLSAPGVPVPLGVAEGVPGVDTLGNLVVFLEFVNGYTANVTRGFVTSVVAFSGLAPDPLEPVLAVDPSAAVTQGQVTGLTSALAAKAQFTTTQSAEGAFAKAWEIVPAASTAAAFQVVAWSAPNLGAGAGTTNRAVFIGWNAGFPQGGPGRANTATIQFGMEDNYYDSTGDGLWGSEAYVEYFSPDRVTVPNFRPFYCRVTPVNTNSPVSAVIHHDIGVAGRYDIFSGLANPVIFTVTPTVVQATKPLTVTGAGITLNPPSGQGIFTINSTNPTILYEVGGANAWYWQAQSTTSFSIFDKDARAHVVYTQGASASAALTRFSSSVQVDGNVGFYGTAPIVQPTSTTDIRTALINLGLLATGGASPLNLNGGTLTALSGVFNGASASLSVTATPSGQASFTLNSAAAQATINYQVGGAAAWYLQAPSVNSFIWYDKNARAMMTFTQGASDTAALITLGSSLRVNGNVGFNNTAPIAKPSATPPLATDLASAIALVNYFRTSVILAYGLAA